jgi:hypothetical protein
MAQQTTGKLTEERVKGKREALGLVVSKPVPDRGVDLEAWLPLAPSRIAKIQVKGRNPEKDPNPRWFQIRVSKAQLKATKDRGLPPDSAWQEKLGKADFVVLDAVKVDETWVFPHYAAVELVRLNEKKYGRRPDNIFTFEEPLTAKQKEMNLDIIVNGKRLADYFHHCLENFMPIMTYLGGDQSNNHR